MRTTFSMKFLLDIVRGLSFLSSTLLVLSSKFVRLLNSCVPATFFNSECNTLHVHPVYICFLMNRCIILATTVKHSGKSSIDKHWVLSSWKTQIQVRSIAGFWGEKELISDSRWVALYSQVQQHAMLLGTAALQHGFVLECRRQTYSKHRQWLKKYRHRK